MKKSLHVMLVMGLLGVMNLGAEERTLTLVTDPLVADLSLIDLSTVDLLTSRKRVPHDFHTGDVAYAADVNENFEALENALPGVEWTTISKSAASISTSGTDIGTVVINAPEDGFVVLQVNGRLNIYSDGQEPGASVTMSEPDVSIMSFKLEGETTYRPLTNLLNGWSSFSLSKVYAVSKGTNSLHFSAKRISGAYSEYYTLNMDATMLATYYPNRY